MQQYVYHIPSKLPLETVVGPMPDGDWGWVAQRVQQAEAVMHQAGSRQAEKALDQSWTAWVDAAGK
eukprot:3763527-Prorocentrum_lima.AAC.1